MKISFSKYQGTGNDFVMLDNRDGCYDGLSLDAVRFLCDRRFGIGADGLIKINAHPERDFEVDYYNADGSKSFCGNGARCSVAFAGALGLDVSKTVFEAIDGKHEANLEHGTVSLLMSDVHEIVRRPPDFTLDTGSPHYIVFTEENVNVVEEGRKIRYSEEFSDAGINVNFVKETGHNAIRVLTYERGVEDETFSCGTGVTAAALAFAVRNGLYGRQQVAIATKGGELSVSFNRPGEQEFTEIYLIGPAQFVFSGVISYE